MQKNLEKAVAVLWTGGKDSCLSLHRVHEKGFRIACLATFVPVGEVNFIAHPIDDMKKQAEALGLPLFLMPVSEPYRAGYIAGLNSLKNEFGVTSVVTGDVDLVNGLPNWIVECCTNIAIEVIRPLWNENRQSLMTELLDRKIEAKITLVSHPALSQDWCGRIIDKLLLNELSALTKTAGIDLCGENGEYHTMVLNAPLFRNPITMKSHNL